MKTKEQLLKRKEELTNQVNGLTAGIQKAQENIQYWQNQITQMVANKNATVGALQQVEWDLKEEGEDSPVKEDVSGPSLFKNKGKK